VASCVAPSDFVTNFDDCDDTNAAISPGVIEIPRNNIDEDCDGMDGLVSTNEELRNLIKVYPNPILDFVQIDIQNLVFYDFKIYNRQGILIRTQKITSSSTNVNVEKLNEGLYCYMLFEEGQLISSGKLVKI